VVAVEPVLFFYGRCFLKALCFTETPGAVRPTFFPAG
jgi:hypothetical protein